VPVNCILVIPFAPTPSDGLHIDGDLGGADCDSYDTRWHPSSIARKRSRSDSRWSFGIVPRKRAAVLNCVLGDCEECLSDAAAGTVQTRRTRGAWWDFDVQRQSGNKDRCSRGCNAATRSCVFVLAVVIVLIIRGECL
jgi:hypothetical protein